MNEKGIKIVFITCGIIMFFLVRTALSLQNEEHSASDRAPSTKYESVKQINSTTPKPASEPRFDDYNAWAAVDAYGKVSYPYGFKLSMSDFDASEKGGIWYVSAYADVTNQFGATRKATVVAAVKPSGDAFEMVAFSVQ